MLALHHVFGQFTERGAAGDQVTHAAVHHCNLMNGNPARIARVVAGRTAAGYHDLPYLAPKKPPFLRRGLYCLPAMGTDLAHQPLGHKPHQGTRQQIGFHSHIPQADHR